MKIKDKYFLTLQYCLPQQLLSRLLGRLMNSRNVWLKNTLIHWFIQRYDIRLTEAASANSKDYDSFNAFFTRALSKGTRTWPSNRKALTSPVDGTISQIGMIKQGTLLQAKGRSFSLFELLGGETPIDYKKLHNGRFATLYLSPADYHRVHMPYAGELTDMVYIPGKLFSVNPITAQHVPNLFSRNERVVCWFDTEFGPMAVILVGAMLVASMRTAWHGIVAPSSLRGIQHWHYDQPKPFNRGDEIGQFQFGSTVIVIIPKAAGKWEAKRQAGKRIQLGDSLLDTSSYFSKPHSRYI